MKLFYSLLRVYGLSYKKLLIFFFIFIVCFFILNYKNYSYEKFNSVEMLNFDILDIDDQLRESIVIIDRIFNQNSYFNNPFNYTIFMSKLDKLCKLYLNFQNKQCSFYDLKLDINIDNLTVNEKKNKIKIELQQLIQFIPSNMTNFRSQLNKLIDLLFYEYLNNCII